MKGLSGFVAWFRKVGLFWPLDPANNYPNQSGKPSLNSSLEGLQSVASTSPNLPGPSYPGS